MRYLYDVTVVDKKTDEILIDGKEAAQSDAEAVLKAAAGKSIDMKKCDVVVRRLHELSKERETVVIEKE